MPDLDPTLGDTASGSDALAGSPPAELAADDTTLADATELQAAEAGPLPLERHKAILEKTRQDYESRYGWSKDLDRHRVEKLVQLGDLLDENPRAAYDLMGSTLKRAGLLETEPGGAAKKETGPPTPDLFTEDGRGAYSAERLQEVLTHFLNPYEKRLAEIENRARYADVVRGAKQEADAIFARASQWPFFEEHREAIWDAMRANTQLSLHDAYITVVVPQVSAASRKSTMNDITRKAAAGGSSRPGNGSAALPGNPADKEWGDLFREEFARLGGS